MRGVLQLREQEQVSPCRRSSACVLWILVHLKDPERESEKVIWNAFSLYICVHSLQDAYLALMMRDNELETGERGIELSDGVKVYMDEEEKAVMKRCGTLQTGQFARRTVALHIQEIFTDVFATDGSKKGKDAAYGGWEGMARATEDMEQNGEEKDREEIEKRIAAGMFGGALPP